MRLRIEAHDLPGTSCGPSPDQPGGYHNIHVAVQRRGRPDDLLGLVRADAPSASWALDCTLKGQDVTGPYIQGPPGGRFVYLSWVTVAADGTFHLFRRAKLQLDAVPPDVLAQAATTGELIAKLGLTDHKGNPTCASVRPPLITWSAGNSA